MRNSRLGVLLTIAAGGVVGSLARWGIDAGMGIQTFPWATLFVNYSGATLLALLITYSEAHPNPRWWWRPLLGTGLCGGFTTYSAFAVQMDGYLQAGSAPQALLYLLASLLGTAVIVVMTVHWARTRWPESPRPESPRPESPRQELA